MNHLEIALLCTCIMGVLYPIWICLMNERHKEDFHRLNREWFEFMEKKDREWQMEYEKLWDSRIQDEQEKLV